MQFTKIINSKLFLTVAVCAACGGATTGANGNPVVYADGHIDIGFGYEGSAWDLHAHDEAANVEYEADGVIFRGVFDGSTQAKSPAPRPADNTTWAFTGAAAGENLYRFPATSENGLPYIGWATEEIASGVFVGNEITIELAGVTGPGAFSVYSFDGNGQIVRRLSSSDTTYDSFQIDTGTHEHYTVAFTEIGEYGVTLRASGTLVGGGTVTSDPTTYSFSVVPEPMSALSGAALFGLLAMRRRASR